MAALLRYTAFVGAIFAVAGCGSSPDPAVRHLLAQAGGPAPEAVTGTWEARFTRNDAGLGGITPGRWVLKLQGTRYEINAPDGDVTRGDMRWDGGVVTFANDVRCGQASRYRRGPGTYTWSTEGEELSFAASDLTELCDPRAAILPTHGWRLVSRDVSWKAVPVSRSTSLAPGASGINPEQPIPASAARPVPERLRGTYTYRLTPAELPGGQIQAGTFRLVLRAREYQIRSSDGNVTRGEIRWARGRATFARDSDCAAFASTRAGPGTYLWNSRGPALSFAFAGGQEPCDPRRPFLTTNVWLRVSGGERFLPEPAALPPANAVPEAPDPKDPVTSTAPVPVEFAGRYSAIFTKADVADKGGTPAGRWLLTLRANRYWLRSPEGTLYRGLTRWDPTRVTFTKDKTCRMFGPRFAGPGTYYWSGSPEGISFRYTGGKEACDPRGPALTTKVWTR